MKILVVGNGFDLAHGLQTSYWSCLNFLYIADQGTRDFPYWRSRIWCDSVRRDIDVDERLENFSEIQIEFLKKYLIQFNSPNIKLVQDNGNSQINGILHECISDNLWLEYFWDLQKAHQKKGHKWVDFESDISEVIQKIDNIVKTAESNNWSLYNHEHDFFFESDFKKNPHLRVLGAKIIASIQKQFTYSSTNDEIKADIINQLYANLLKLTTAIEIYLKTCGMNFDDPFMGYLEIDHVDKVISFNYTDTFKMYMNNDNDENICHIHGKIREKLTSIYSPLVLGIDEYLSKEERDNDVDWVMFKKFFQRIYRHSDFKYKGWPEFSSSDEIKKSTTELYIVGHSLDVTDRDVLRDLILRDNQITKIFYRNSTQMANELKNLIRVIGSDELNKRCRSIPPSIIFVEQKYSYYWLCEDMTIDPSQ